MISLTCWWHPESLRLIGPSLWELCSVSLTNFTNWSFLRLRFLKQFLCEDRNTCVMNTLDNKSTSNESNSASCNGQHELFSSNTNQSFLLEFFKIMYLRTKSLPWPETRLSVPLKIACIISRQKLASIVRVGVNLADWKTWKVAVISIAGSIWINGKLTATL